MSRTCMIVVALALFVGMLAGCGGPKMASTTTGRATEEIADKIPEWYKNPPQDPNYYYQTSTETSRNMNLARNKAIEDAISTIGLNIKSDLATYRSQFQEEVGSAVESAYYEKMSQVSERVANLSIQDARMEKSEILAEDGVWRAYVLCSMPKASALEMFDDQISQDEEDATRWHESQTRKRMYEIINGR